MSEEWITLLPEKQLYSLIVPMGFDAYNLLIFWISGFPPITPSYFLVSNPWFFAQLSNQPFERFKDYALPLSTNRILSTWNKAIADNEQRYVIYVESMYLLRQLLFSSAEIIQFIRKHRQWKFVVLSTFGQDQNDERYIEQQFQSSFVYFKSNLRSAPRITSDLIDWSDARIWLRTLSEKGIIITDSNRMADIHLNYSQSYVYSELSPPEGITNWGLLAQDWLVNPNEKLLITSSTFLPTLYGVRILIIDTMLDTNQYLTLLFSLIRPSMEPDLISVYFINGHCRLDIRDELKQMQNNFSAILKSASCRFSSFGHRKIKLELLE